MPKIKIGNKWIGDGEKVFIIAEGCDNRCAYCVIPSIRGGFRSKRKEDILDEAKELAAAGCKELILIAQDVTKQVDGNTIRYTYKYDGYSFHVDAEVDAVQTHNAQEAIKSAWGVDVSVNDDETVMSLQ